MQVAVAKVWRCLVALWTASGDSGSLLCALEMQVAVAKVWQCLVALWAASGHSGTLPHALEMQVPFILPK